MQSKVRYQLFQDKSELTKNSVVVFKAPGFKALCKVSLSEISVRERRNRFIYDDLLCVLRSFSLFLFFLTVYVLSYKCH